MQRLHTVSQVRARAYNAVFGGIRGLRVQVRVASELEPLIPRFLANRRTEIASLEQAVESRDVETLRRIGHGLKGVGGGYGFDEITRIGAQIENCAKTGNNEATRRLVRALKRYLDDVEVSFD